jgi:ATP-dependent exoDNAse (exonuclease V) beta subunit
LEATLARAAQDALARLAQLLPRELIEALWSSSIGAAGRWAGDEAAMAALAGAEGPAAAEPQALALWQAIARLVLTDAGDWRKQVNKRTGFPTTHREDRDRHERLIVAMSAIDGALEAWRAVAESPPVRYDETQWRVLAALLSLLKRLAAHLRIVFTEHGRVDYTEVALAARDALGRPEEPTDLALRLDYRIRHILVDEFQDTSLGQIELLRRLTAGWSGTDGRTLFCVGDPMQSIYRFRQTDVALFLRVRRHGIESLRPQTLTLAQNFRSQAGIVDWVNRAFAEVLPREDDFGSGAVRYTPVQPTHPHGPAPAVRVWPALEPDPIAEARQVVAIVRNARTRRPDARIAILARSRSHMREVAAALRAAGLAFQAIDFEALNERRAVRDLCALTRALCHCDDRIAWLALLRAPFAGVPLADLEVLGSGLGERTVVEALTDTRWLERLTPQGRARIARVAPILAAALGQFGRRPLAALVEGAWLALGGPAAVDEQADLDNARAFFERLGEEERSADLDDPAELDASLSDLHAAPDVSASDGLQLLTIHRAKGLEWDVVIVPGLGRAPRSERRRLLHALDLESGDGHSGLLLAPARPAARDSDPLEAFVLRLEKKRAMLESARLLYVAATRAKTELHLFGHATLRATRGAEEPPEPRPAANSLLAVLWPVVRGEFSKLEAPGRAQLDGEARAAGDRSKLRRLVSGWQLPSLPPRPGETARELGEAETRLRPDFDWATEVARLVGVVVHRDLERRVRTRIATGRILEIDATLYRAELRELGVPAERLHAAAERVAEAVRRLLEDDRGRWILAPHADETSEWALTAECDGELRRLIVDRSFVDDEGTRWIIDYKTSAHEGGSLDEFLAQEELRYAPQLERYASVVSRLTPAPVRIALYYPLLGAWRELGGPR